MVTPAIARSVNEQPVISEVKVNCGCGRFTFTSENPVAVVKAATQHVQETGHSVDVLGRIRTEKAPVRIDNLLNKHNRFKTRRKDDEE